MAWVALIRGRTKLLYSPKQMTGPVCSINS